MGLPPLHVELGAPSLHDSTLPAHVTPIPPSLPPRVPATMGIKGAGDTCCGSTEGEEHCTEGGTVVYALAAMHLRGTVVHNYYIFLWTEETK